MEALVKYSLEPNSVEVREVPEPVIGPHDVLVRTAACGICGSDLELARGAVSYKVRVPVILGHEFAGKVEAVGDAVEGFAVGDRVVSETAYYICDRCPQCRTGNYNLCPDRRGFGILADGAFAPLVRVPTRCLHRVPDSVPLEHAALTEPFCVAYNALVVKSHIRPGDVVVVFGPGPIGLCATQVARVNGASQVILVGLSLDRERLAVGARTGATVTVDSEVEDLPQVVAQMTDGLGADLVVDAAGPNPVLQQATSLVRPSGQITKIGWDPRPVGFSLDPLLERAVTLQGCFSHTWDTWERVLRLMAAGQIQAAPFITHRVPLSDWQRAFDAVESRHAVKAMIVFENSE